MDKEKSSPKGASGGRTTLYPKCKHSIPCEDCGSKDWPNWTLLPHELFNSVCPGGNGYLCFPCFVKRAAPPSGDKLLGDGK